MCRTSLLCSTSTPGGELSCTTALANMQMFHAYLLGDRISKHFPHGGIASCIQAGCSSCISLPTPVVPAYIVDQLGSDDDTPGRLCMSSTIFQDTAFAVINIITYSTCPKSQLMLRVMAGMQASHCHRRAISPACLHFTATCIASLPTPFQNQKPGVDALCFLFDATVRGREGDKGAQYKRHKAIGGE